MGAGRAMRVSAFDTNQPTKKSNDLKRLITADPNKTGWERKEKGNNSLSEGELGRGSFRKIYARHFLCFLFSFVELHLLLPPLSVSLAFF
jgi:hypothetical protein